VPDVTERDLRTDPSATPPEIEDPEAPEADVLEQRTAAVETAEEEETPDVGVEADPADVAEQSRTVELDDDEYR
jgi:hypothetical protein